jgi:putative transcriptional regulator
LSAFNSIKNRIGFSSFIGRTPRASIDPEFDVSVKESELDKMTSRLYYLESELDMASRIQNRVKDLRQRRGWTQQQLADAVGVSRQSINSIECNRYVPSLPLALSFARVFGCATDEIFSLEIPRGDSESIGG